MVVDGQLKSRAFKQFPNDYVHKLFSGIDLDGFDGEIVIGDPTSADARNKTSGTLNRKSDKEVDAKLYVFDNYKYKGGYDARYQKLKKRFETPYRNVVLVEQRCLALPVELEFYEREVVALGYEGVIVRSLDGPYKFGRSTHKEGYMLKVKRFLDSEAEILEVIEEQENTNEAKKDAFGRSKRSSAQEGMVPKGQAGALYVKDLTTGVCFTVGSGISDDLGKRMWNNRRKLLGRTITYKYFPHGVKDKPLLPSFVGFREKWDF